MKSGHDNYAGIWGNPYYDNEAVPLRRMIFTSGTFIKSPALVAINAVTGIHQEIEYKGQPFDPRVWRLAPNGWDHQHCCVCQFSIAEGMTYWSTEDGRRILCDACYEHYIK